MENILRADQAEPICNWAVQTAAAACAADTAGQTCYICMDGAAEEGLVRGCACRGAAGVAHVSCLARQAERTFDRWHTCGLCKQEYHGVVACALGWACWKTYVGRPETDDVRLNAMSVLGNGLGAAKEYEAALTVREADLSIKRRVGASEDYILTAQGNIAVTYGALGRVEEALQMRRDVYSGRLKLSGEERVETIRAANNYANILRELKKFEEAKLLLRKTIPVARRVLGENNDLTLVMKMHYAMALYEDDSATLDGLREAVTTLEDIEGIARRVLGGAHPLTTTFEKNLRNARAALRAREEAAPDDVSSICEGLDAMRKPGDA